MSLAYQWIGRIVVRFGIAYIRRRLMRQVAIAGAVLAFAAALAGYVLFARNTEEG